MDILNRIDFHYLLSVSVIFLIFCVFYYNAIRRQNAALVKVDESIKRQEQANQQLSLIVNELRRTNRLLAEMTEVESAEGYSSAGETTQPGTNSAPSDNQYKLYVGNIDYTATEAELGSYFADFGQVEFVNIPVNRYTGKTRGFGFVTFGSREDAERAMALHGTEFKGRQIQVNFAKERDNA